MIKRIFSSSFFRSAGIYTTANFVNAAIPFLMLPVLTRYLTPRDYGIVAMFQILFGIVGTFTGLSVYGAITRQYYERDLIDLPNYVGNCLYILAGSSAVVGAVLWLGAAPISRLTDYPGDWLWAVLAISAAQFVTIVPLTLWQAEGKAAAYGKFQVLLTLVNVSLSLWFIVGLGMDWRGRIQGQVIAYLLFAMLGFWFLHREGWLKWGVHRGYLKNALDFGIPLVPHTFGMWAITMTDRALITNLVGVESTGVYVVGAQIGMVISLLQDSFNRAWVPWFFEQLKREDPQVKMRIVKLTYLYNVAIVAGSVLFALVAPPFLRVFVGKNFQGASDYILWIALGYAFNGMYKMVTNYIFYLQKTRILAWATFMTAVLNVGICYVLIKANGPIGAAQGTMLAFLISFLLTWFGASRIYPMPWLFFLKPLRT